MPQTPSLPQPKSAVADFGHFVEWPNPRYSEVRLGRGRGWGFEPVCTPVPLGTTPHPDPPPQGGRESTRLNPTPMGGRPLWSLRPPGTGRPQGSPLHWATFVRDHVP